MSINQKEYMSKCYQCKFRGTVPGSAHSSCTVLRTVLDGMDDGKIAAVEVALMTGQATLSSEDGEAVKLNPHGVKNGWANWPLDFDPVWVEKCELFVDKETKSE
jgi:hypothetical protein